MTAFLKKIFGITNDTVPAGIEAALNAIPAAAFLIDAHDRIRKTNTTGTALLGDTPATQSLPARLGSSELISFLKTIRDNNAGTAPVEITLRRAPAPEIRLECTAAKIAPPAAAGTLFVVLRDITHQHRLETLRRDFVSDVSHDLRTPVTILKGFAETLREDYDTLDDAERRRFAERLAHNAGRLHRLLESILELATLENNNAPANLEKGILHKLIRETTENFAEKFSAAGIEIAFTPEADDACVAVDAAKFLRILQNLFENALRHASGATCIRISTTTSAAGEFVFSVADNGPGVAQADAERLFDRFFRADKSRAGTAGSGLGLSIVKQLAELHGGRVTALPNRPRGLTIQVTLPKM